MPSDATAEVTFPTPAGNEARYLYRVETTDWNTLASCCKEDEYGLPSGIGGAAADIGAHIGGATIALALDNPGLVVVAVEPIPENVAMLRANVALNDLSERVVILEGAVGADTVYYGWHHTESSSWHRYIGNLTGESGAPQVTLRPRVFTLDDIMNAADTDHLAYVKTDCEGGEWEMFLDPLVGNIDAIAGEWHAVNGMDGSDVIALLGDTHDVTFTTGVGGGGFRAVRHL